MRLLSTEAKVGAVVIAALAGLAWLTFQIGEFRFRQQGYVIEAVFKTVSGLETQSKVRMAGVLVGTVERIFLKDGLAHTSLRLDDGVVVREDSVVSVASIGILSERYIEITAGSPGAKALAPGAVVAGRELVDLDQLMAEISRSSESFRSLAASIEKTFTGGDSQVSHLLASATDLVNRISTVLEENRQRVGELLAQAAGLARDARSVVDDNRAELHAAIAGMHTLAETLNRRADEVAAEATKTAEELRATVRGGREDFQGLLASMRAAAGSAEKAADTLTKILAKVDEGKGTIGRLVNNETTIDKVDATLGDIEGIAKKINTGQGSLGRLVTDDTLVKKLESTADSAQRMLGVNDRMHFYLGYRGEYLERVTALKSYVSVKLQPRADKYYLFEIVDDPAGKTTVTKTKTTIQQPDGSFVIDETEEMTVDDKLLFSLMFAKSVGPLTFRGGLMESQGGVGLDYRLANDKLKLTAEGWHFGREGGPHLKVTGQVAVYKDFFLNAGVDDWYDEKRRSVFVGGGILFSDEDLREMLGLARLAQ